MKLKQKIILLAILFSLAFFILDAIIGATYYKDLNFLQVLLTATPYHDFYSRLIAFALVVIFAIIVNSMIDRKPKKESEISHYSGYSADPMLMVNVSNHIRTPLNAIQGFIELLNDPGINDSSKKLYINHIKTSSRYLLELVNNVTDITLLESGSMYIDKDEFRLNELMTDLHTRYSNIIREKGKRDLAILLKTNIKDDQLTVNGDKKRIKQVLENLLENATAFTDEGVIEFGYHAKSENSIDFFVKDTGAGISPERLELVFSGSRVIDDRMAPFDLASMRLNIARQLVRLMGGELKPATELNVGSEFRFELPVNIRNLDGEEGLGDKTSAYEKEADKEKEKPKWSGKTILIAEDVESNFIYLQEILKETGVNVIWAENGKIAYETVIGNSGIDLVLMDILMPEMDGYEATIKIKKELPHLPVIAQTAYHLDEHDYKDARLYFDKILIKPIWSHDLIAALNERFN